MDKQIRSSTSSGNSCASGQLRPKSIADLGLRRIGHFVNSDPSLMPAVENEGGMLASLWEIEEAGTKPERSPSCQHILDALGKSLQGASNPGEHRLRLAFRLLVDDRTDQIGGFPPVVAVGFFHQRRDGDGFRVMIFSTWITKLVESHHHGTTGTLIDRSGVVRS